MPTDPTEAEKLLILKINYAETDGEILGMVREYVASQVEAAVTREAAAPASWDDRLSLRLL